MDDYYKRSGQIPAFGDWDYANDLPITQYFECARQAGLIRFSSSSGESADHPYNMRPDLYAIPVDHFKKPSRDVVPVDHFKKPSRNVAPSRKATRGVGGGGGGGREKRGQRAHVMEQKRQQSKVAKVCDVTEPPTKPYHYQLHVQQQPNRTHHHHHRHHHDTVPRRPPKPVDEDLYKIPPELLHTTKRKKMLRMFACLVPACAS